MILMVLSLTSCGSLTITPRACKTKAIWGNSDPNELSIKEDYYLYFDNEEVLLKDILTKNNIKCDQINTLRVKIHSSFFIKRTVEIFYTAKSI